MVNSPTSAPSGKPRTAALCGQGLDEALYLLQTVSPLVDLQLVLWEQPRSKWKVLRQLFRRRKQMGWSYPLDRILLGVYSRLFLRKAAAGDPACTALEAARSFVVPCPQESVATIHVPRVREALLEVRPELVLVLGTSIIKPPVLETAPLFVNVHSGITPLYRGAHGAVWAVIQRDFEHLGVTVHRVDKGIDTGAILKQVQIPFDPRHDNLITLSAKQAVAGAGAVAEWLVENRGALA
jgi:folate-dependent phosphoribosylglycinamide formyltransferase PurN